MTFLEDLPMTMRAPEPTSLELRLLANANQAHRLRRRLRGWLDRAGVSRDETFEIVAAVSEAFINAVEHAQDPSSPQIDVTAEVVDHHVTLAVHDRGSWRVEPRRPGGHGLLIMRTFMSSVEVQSATGSTTVTMRRELRVPAGDTLSV
jgi:anti-sigma regulatory factor (Ser/Thr protein kinase)